MTRSKSKSEKKRKQRSSTHRSPPRRDLKVEDLEAALARAQPVLSQDDHQVLKAAVETLVYLTAELEAKGASIRRLRALIFGPSTEKTSRVVGEGAVEETSAASKPAEPAPAADQGASTNTAAEASKDGAEGAEKKKRKGHGRRAAETYTGAERVTVPHATLARGQQCPRCERGKLYPLPEPSLLVRVSGVAPLSATLYELSQLRCNLCGHVFTAKEPEGVGTAKYDETATSMIGLLRYGCGFPFNRLEGLEESLGIPLPSGTQFEVVEQAADLLEPAQEELIRRAAQGEILHNDDTTMKILDLEQAHKKALASGEAQPKDRCGVFTSGIVSVGEGHRIALFFTGKQHAGENLADVLSRRASELGPPIQMCDGLPANTSGTFETIVSNCLAHARRNFVYEVTSFPEECRFVLEQLKIVFKNDDEVRSQGLTPEERLLFHQERSGPVMQELSEWLEAQIAEKKVEPNSGLGQAINYMRKRWDELTLFLREAGAPLDNNLCERALKKAILHRKGSLFYKTENGARVGDLFMSLIHTCELNGANPFEYLTELQRHHRQLAEHPEEWLPWNYRETLSRLVADQEPPTSADTT